MRFPWQPNPDAQCPACHRIGSCALMRLTRGSVWLMHMGWLKQCPYCMARFICTAGETVLIASGRAENVLPIGGVQPKTNAVARGSLDRDFAVPKPEEP